MTASLASNTDVSIFLDTGAEVDLLQYDYFSTLTAETYTKLPCHQEARLTGIDGSPLDLIGRVQLTVHIGDADLQFKPYVVKGVGFPADL